ncbi:hypothetical protein [Sphingomonas faeni]|uniref:hypothetical protein n=1 Tax=Sphingomonas faeni TaxID=185950 RepID=UPI002413B8F7|nr:hypothetical protein [Sphingomonas faeni]
MFRTSASFFAAPAWRLYAPVFSTEPMVRGYACARRWIEGRLAIVFTSAGLKLFTAC